MMDRRIGPLVVAVAAAALISAAEAKQPSVDGERFEFRVHDLEGRPVSWDDPRFQGKVVFVDLWATWCAPCLTEIPTFNDLHRRYADDGLVVVAIAFERESDNERRRAHLRDFATGRGIEYLVLDGGPTDEFGETLPQMRGVGGLPIEIFIDRDGTVVRTRNGYGYTRKWARRLEARLRDMLDLPAG